MSFTNNSIHIAGNVINDDAKIIGITLAIAGLIGICVFWAPIIFLPTTFKIPNINNIAVTKPFVLNAPFTLIKLKIDVNADGIPDTIPANINIEIPFPTPLDVILSPSHIKNDVPATSEDITTIAVVTPVSINNPEFLYEKYIPKASTNANASDISFVILSTFFLPSSPPSFVNLSKEGIIIANNCTMIDDVIYGVIDIANIDNLENAPPDTIFINPVIPFEYCVIVSSNVLILTIGTVIKQPNLKITSNNKVNNNFFLISGDFNAFLIVLNN